MSGKNFLMKETFEYAKERVANKRENKTIDGFRLFNNLLSSQPMAFNLFYPLMLLLKQDPAVVTLAVRSVFRNFPVFEVTEIGLEFIPTPMTSLPWMRIFDSWTTKEASISSPSRLNIRICSE